MTHTLRNLALPTALAGTLILASCGTSSNGGHDVSGMNGRTTGAPIATGTQTTGPKNAVDVAFATMMIPLMPAVSRGNNQVLLAGLGS